jgi:hypothetical protein
MEKKQVCAGICYLRHPVENMYPACELLISSNKFDKICVEIAVVGALLIVLRRRHFSFSKNISRQVSTDIDILLASWMLIWRSGNIDRTVHNW